MKKKFTRTSILTLAIFLSFGQLLSKNTLSFSLNGGMCQQEKKVVWFEPDAKHLKTFGFGELSWEKTVYKSLSLKSGFSFVHYHNRNKVLNYSTITWLSQIVEEYTTTITNSFNIGLPILLDVQLNKFQFNFGLQLSQQISNKKSSVRDTRADGELLYDYQELNSAYFSNSGWGVRTGIQYHVTKNFLLDFTYQNQLGGLFENNPNTFSESYNQFSFGLSYKFLDFNKYKNDDKSKFFKGSKTSIGVDVCASLVFFNSKRKTNEGAVITRENNSLAQPVLSPQLYFIWNFVDSALLNLKVGAGFQTLKYYDAYSDNRSMFGDIYEDTLTLQSVTVDISPQTSLNFGQVQLNLFAGLRTTITTNAQLQGSNDWYCYNCDDDGVAGLSEGTDRYDFDILDQVNKIKFGPNFGTQIAYKTGKLSLNYTLSVFLSLTPNYQENSSLDWKYDMHYSSWFNNSFGLRYDLF